MCVCERGGACPACSDQDKEESTGRAHAALEVTPKPVSGRNPGVLAVGRGKRCVCRWSPTQETRDIPAPAVGQVRGRRRGGKADNHLAATPHPPSGFFL